MKHRSIPGLVIPMHSAIIRSLLFTSFFFLGFNPELSAQYSLKSWGRNDEGQLATGDKAIRTTPVIVESTPVNGSKIMHVSANGSYTTIVREDGSIWSCGSNYQGQLGLGNRVGTTEFRIAQTGAGPQGRYVKSAGSTSHLLALREDGSLWAWGSSHGFLNGFEAIDAHINSAVQLDSRSGNRWVDVGACAELAVSVGVSSGACIAQRSDGQLYTWGNGMYGVLGNGRASGGVSYPTAVVDITGYGWKTFSMGYYYVIAILNDGSLWGWGSGAQGQIASSDTGTRLLPTKIDPGTDLAKGGPWTAVAAGDAHALAIRANGSLWGWGSNTSGCLGLGHGNMVAKPTLIDDGTNGKWVQISAGNDISFGMKEDGSIWSWGSNTFGAMADGTTTSSTLYYRPQEITALGKVDITSSFIARGAPSGSGFLVTEGGKAPAICFAPTLRITSNTLSGTSFSWLRFAGVAGYEIAVDQSATRAPSGTATSLIDTFYSVNTLTQGNLYYVHFRTNCGNGNYSMWDTISFYAPLPCTKPSNIYADMIGSKAADIYWSKIQGSQEYELAIDQSAILPPTSQTFTTVDTFYFASMLPSDVRLYVHIRNNCGLGNYSLWDTISFRTLPACNNPDFVTVNPIRAEDAHIVWKKMAGVTSYQVAVDQSPTLMPSSAATSTADTSFDAIGLNEDRIYYVHLRSSCPNGQFGAWDTVSFRTLPKDAAGLDADPVAGQIHIYPNPVSSVLFIDAPQGISVQLFALDGRLLLDQKVSSSGISMSPYATGVYLLTLRDAQGRMVRTERIIRTEQY